MILPLLTDCTMCQQTIVQMCQLGSDQKLLASGAWVGIWQSEMGWGTIYTYGEDQSTFVLALG